MSFDVQCGSCNERISVTQQSGVITCPHCRTSLQLPEQPGASGSQTGNTLLEGQPGGQPAENASPSSLSVGEAPPTSSSDETAGRYENGSRDETGNAAASEGHAESGRTAETGDTSQQPAALNFPQSKPRDSDGVAFPGLPTEDGPASDVTMPMINTGETGDASAAADVRSSNAADERRTSQDVPSTGEQQTAASAQGSNKQTSEQTASEQTANPVIGPPPDSAAPSEHAFPGISTDEPDRWSASEQSDELDTSLNKLAEAVSSESSAGFHNKSGEHPATLESSQPLPPDSRESGVLATANSSGSRAAANEATPTAAPRREPSSLLVVMLIGYATAVTAALVWLYLTRGRRHPLESLPDINPQAQGYLIPEDAPMPPGHTLGLGDTQRFGSLEVTPLKVTRGPAVQRMFGSDETLTTGPVLKLWLKIRNVSEDQTFKPFGRKLMMLRGRTEKRSAASANIFVCRPDEKRKDGRLVYVFPLPDYQTFVEQHLEHKLAPGEEYMTFIASEEIEPDTLEGDLLWRVHMRKGYHPETKHGVTTLFEVAFHSRDIVEEDSAG